MSWFINNGSFIKNIAILRAKGVTFRCTLAGISKNKALKRFNDSVTYDRGVLYIWIFSFTHWDYELTQDFFNQLSN